MKYDMTRGQLVTLWIFGALVWFWAIGELGDYSPSSFAGPLFFLIPAALIFYTIGWSSTHRKDLIPEIKKDQIENDPVVHNHSACEIENQRNRRQGIFWLGGPFALLTIILTAFAIAQFVASSLGIPDTTVFGLIRVILGLFGVIAVIGILVGIPLGIVCLSKRKFCFSHYDKRSGKFGDSVVPEGVRKFNWGAFTFGWIWGAYNNVWISFLSFIPIFNLFFAFYLGFMGNELAWRKSKWVSEEAFHTSQKKWAIVAAFTHIGFLMLILLSIIFDDPSTSSNSVNSTVQNSVPSLHRGPLNQEDFFGTN